MDVGTGNLLVSTAALSLPGVTSSTEIGASYNSRSATLANTNTMDANRWQYALAGAGDLTANANGVVYTDDAGTAWQSPGGHHLCPSNTNRYAYGAENTLDISNAVGKYVHISVSICECLCAGVGLAWDSSGKAITGSTSTGNPEGSVTYTGAPGVAGNSNGVTVGGHRSLSIWRKWRLEPGAFYRTGGPEPRIFGDAIHHRPKQRTI